MPDEQFDLVVAGAGAAGLGAAVVAHSKGLRVVIVEKSRFVGGTTSLSGAVCWVPGSRQNRELGIEDSAELATQYLDSVVGDRPGRDARLEYVRRAPEAFEYLERVSHLKYFARPNNSPDYFPDAPGAQLRGRALTPVNYDGRLLGDRFGDLRPPLPELCLFGRTMVDGVDLHHLLNARRSVRSAVHASKVLWRDFRDRIFHRSYGRGTHLTAGNAAVARLYKTVLEMGIPVLLDSPILRLQVTEGRVRGVVVRTGSGERGIAAACGVVLATGGFPWAAGLRADHIPHVPFGYSAASPDSTGDGISVAVTNGAKLATGNSDGAFWTPVSLGKRRDGTTAHVPHLMADRSKPGLIAVDGNGERFCNESENYHDVARAMVAGPDRPRSGPYHLLCDHDFVRKYVFGMVAPLPGARRRHVRSGYLLRAGTLAGLAGRMGVDADALRRTVERYNQHAAQGDDPEFGRGSTAYNRYLGDPGHKPNPCVAPIGKAPFYAIRVFPGDIGTSFGLSTDLSSRVLDEAGNVIEGLYACGNDRNSVMGGLYPSAGITIGPALTFAYLAALDAARVKASRTPQAA